MSVAMPLPIESRVPLILSGTWVQTALAGAKAPLNKGNPGRPCKAGSRVHGRIRLAHVALYGCTRVRARFSICPPASNAEWRFCLGPVRRVSDACAFNRCVAAGGAYR